MAVSPWSATVSATTPAASVTLAPDAAGHAHQATSPVLRSMSAWSSTVSGTTLAGAVILVPDNAGQAHTADGADPVVVVAGYGEGGYGEGGYGGVIAAGQVLAITAVSPATPAPPVNAVDPTAPDPAAAVWSWSIGSWRTGPSVPLSQARNRRVTWRLVGRHEASFDLDGTTEAAAAVEELITDLWITRSPVPNTARCVFRGRVGRTEDAVDATNHTVTVNVGDYRAVLDRRQLWEGGQLSWLNTDQSAIAFGLVQHTQAQAGGQLGIVQGVGAISGISRVRNDYPPGKRIGEAIDQLSQVIDGFDWDITPNANPRNPALTLDVFYPSRGVDRQQVLALGDRLARADRQVDPGEYANAERGTGADSTSTGGTLAPVRREATDIATRPEGRWDGSMSDPDLTVQQTVVDRTNRELAQRQVITPDWVVTLKPNSWGGPDDIWLGDPVVLVVKSGRLNVVESLRVIEIPCSWDDDDNLTTQLALAAVVRPNKRWSLRRVDQRLQALERR